MEQIFSKEELEQMGLVETHKGNIDHLGKYIVYGFHKNNSRLEIVNEFMNDGKKSSYVEFNNEELKGRRITILDIKILKELM